MKNAVRRALLAGSWYPGTPERLRETIEGYAADAGSPNPAGDLLALVTPHAGLAYSGRVAARAWLLAAAGRWESVILIGPSHRVRFAGGHIHRVAGYESPLGILPVDEDLAGRLAATCDFVSRSSDTGVPENAIEVNVPFIQSLLPGVPFVPLLLGTQDRKTCEAIAAAVMRETEERKVLLAASSDFSHFLDYDEAKRVDGAALALIRNNDRDGFASAVEKGDCEACGHGAILVAMAVAEARGCDAVHIAEYANSGDVTGDRANVVGYAAVAFTRTVPSSRNRSRRPGEEEQAVILTEREEQELLAIAREGIASVLEDRPPAVSLLPSANLDKQAGVFVTLRQRGRLRGCIGYIHGTGPLREAVADAARAAAFHDPRFPPLSADELETVDTEISVLSPLREVRHSDEIDAGSHGLYVTSGGSSGLLLPQVAREHGWDKKTFLEETCLKAGLPKHAWMEDDSRVHVFTAHTVAAHPKPACTGVQLKSNKKT